MERFVLGFSVLVVVIYTTACSHLPLRRVFSGERKEDYKHIRLNLAQSWSAFQGIPLLGNHSKYRCLDFCMVGIGSLGLPTQQGMLYLEMNYDTLKFDYQSDSLRLIGQYLLPSSPTIKNFTLFDPITYDAFVQTEVYYEPYRIGKWVVIDENIKMHRYGDVSFLPMNCTCDGKSKLIRTSLSKYDGVPILDDEHTYVELCLTKGKEERINVGKGEGIFRLNRRNRIDFKYEMDDLLVSIEYVVPPQPTVEYHASLDTLTNQVEVNKISYYELYRTSTRILKGGKLTHFENKASFLPRPNICDSLYYRDIDW